MKQKSFDKIRPKTIKIPSNSNTAKFRSVFLSGDFNGCVLALPEILRAHGQTMLYQGRFPKCQLCRLGAVEKKAGPPDTKMN